MLAAIAEHAPDQEHGKAALLLSGSHLRDENRKAADPPPVHVASIVHAITVDLQPLFDAYRESIEPELAAGAIRAYNASGQNTARSIGAGVEFSFDLRNDAVLEAIHARANMLSGDVAADVFDGMRDTIAGVFWQDRQGSAAVARELRAQFDDLTAGRSERIARTETLVAVETATHDSFIRDGIERKGWFAAVNNPTPPRPAHQQAHDDYSVVGVPIDQPFIVGGEPMDHPGDPTASPGNVVNCRCAATALISEPLGPEDFWDGS